MPEFPKRLSLAGQLRVLRYRWWVVLYDFATIPVAWLGAYWLRYNLGEVPDEFLAQAWRLLPLVLIVQGGALLFFGTHRGVWRFTSLPDLVRILKAVVAGTALLFVSLFFYTRLEHVPRSVFFSYALLLAVLLGGARIAYRLIKDHYFGTKIEKKVMVVGAGAAGEMLVRDLRRTQPRIYDVVVFIDDDPAKLGKEIHGIRVSGGCEQIPVLCERWGIDLVLIAMPSASSAQMQRAVSYSEKAGLPIRTLPRLHDLVVGNVDLRAFREVSIDDLLGREPVRLERERIHEMLTGRRVLVTGAGGSIGSELCRQLAVLRPECLVLFEQSELNLYNIERELRGRYPELALTCLLGDVCDEAAVRRLFQRERPQIVFHAAAYKHVPLLEGQVREAVRNNVLGTRAVAQQADRAKCAAFVLISTDKAVNPRSVMGACKRVAEIYCQALDGRSETRFATVRFGNVLGSTGSVVPLFREQIERGGPVTVTHPDMTRYFMTPSEAAQLILEASSVGRGGEIFVLDMGEPVRISYLAEQMIRLSGKTPGSDIRIEYTGLREGEKLSEELFHQDEGRMATGHDKILLASSRPVDWKVILPLIERMEQLVQACDEPALIALLQHLIPEFVPEQASHFAPEPEASAQ
jgi:FlaA1/EpsC-like NDP-sugar epimerase